MFLIFQQFDSYPHRIGAMSTKVGSMGSGRPVLGGHNTTRFFLLNHKSIGAYMAVGNMKI